MNILIMFNYIFYFAYGIYCRRYKEDYFEYKENIGQNGIILVYIVVSLLVIGIRYYGLYKDLYFESIEVKYFIFIRLLEPLQVLLSIEIIKILAGKIFSKNKKQSQNSFLREIIGFISNQSFYIYIYHALFIDILIRIFSRIQINPNQYRYYILLFCGTIFTSCVSAFITRYIPGISYVLGNKYSKYASKVK